MSTKPSVGDVYGKIVNEVIESSRTAFEEDGIDMSALDLLQQEWQHKLSELKVTGLPWDPTPTAVAKQQETLLSGNAKQLSQNGNISPPVQSSLNTPPQPRPDASSYPRSTAPQYPAPNFRQGQPDSAQARAAANLNQIYGPRASAQIAELQGAQRFPQMQADGHIKQEDKQQAPTYIKQEATPALPHLNNYHANATQRPHPIKTDQTDGAGDALDDWQVEYARRKEAFRQMRARDDRLIRNHVKASQQQLEGGGLMVPLDERSDAADDIEGEETTGNVMLCTYDKVQRVKNKWKCTLKDGIMGIDGQE
ncbi:hypothetical protein DV737_g424, partial [Chaetothyriales sp. CBS 132003]